VTSTNFQWKAFASGSSLPLSDAISRSPLLAGLWALWVSKEQCSNQYLSYHELENIFQDELDIAMDVPVLKKAFATAGDKVIRRKPDGALKISAAGEKHLLKFKTDEPLQIIYVEPKTPRTAKKNLEVLVSSIKQADLRINDPYYGLSALDVIEMFLKHHKSVKFLTVKLGGGENSSAVTQRIKDLKMEYKAKFEIRLGNSSEVHDRYVIATDTFFLVGQGIKDLGNKESFILSIDDKVGKEIRVSLTTNFDTRWKTGNIL
jgi:hypothetical protein